MIRVGLTGGIGVGKTLACEIFLSLGVPVIDADEIVRELSAPGEPAWKNIRSVFGDDILDSQGTIDRDKLRRLVFSDENKKKQLEKILHPAVKKKIQHLAASLKKNYCIICIPLMIESNMLNLVDTVIVIDCPESVQVERVKKRSKLNESEILKIISSQVSRNKRVEKADIVIDNSGDKTILKRRLESLHGDLMRRITRQVT